MALDLENHLLGIADAMRKSRERLTKDFDPDQPRDKNGRWVHLGHVVQAVDGPSGRVTGISGGRVSIEHEDRPSMRKRIADFEAGRHRPPRPSEIRSMEETARRAARRPANLTATSVPLSKVAVLDSEKRNEEIDARSENVARRREAEELAEEERNNRVKDLRAKLKRATDQEERELLEEEIEDTLHPGRYKG